MRRKKMSYKKSKREFKKKTGVQALNQMATTPRGGFRL